MNKKNNYLNINGDIAFISDSHYNSKRTLLKKHLIDILEQKNKYKNIKNLILMGDIFDFLNEDVIYSIHKNEKILKIINSIANTNKMKVIYLEGNHDFNISSLFDNIQIIPLNRQPLKINNNGIKILISHGDIFTPTLYNIYTYIIRTKSVLKMANWIDNKLNNKISKKLNNSLQNKNICNKIQNFRWFANKRIKIYKKQTNYAYNLIIEGHYHQGKQHKNYINISSLACDNKVNILRNAKLLNTK
jgi:UDP-2,3-diacylglucosamine hydrolase